MAMKSCRDSDCCSGLTPAVTSHVSESSRLTFSSWSERRSRFPMSRRFTRYESGWSSETCLSDLDNAFEMSSEEVASGQPRGYDC